MKRTIQVLVATIVFLSSTVAILAQGPETQRLDPGRKGSGARGGQLGLISALPHESLSQDEIDALMLMREEEKLARDVYLALYDMWEIPVFLNIATSEQRHFEAIGTLVEKYELVDAAENEMGKFTPGSEMESLYGKLVAAGEASLEEALRVGATIEDLDIYDLRRLLEITDNKDIQIVFQNLLNGSMNHLRAFTRLLKPEVYEAQYLSQGDIEEIINTSRNAGRYGNGQCSCALCGSKAEPGAGNCRRRGGSGN